MADQDEAGRGKGHRFDPLAIIRWSVQLDSLTTVFVVVLAVLAVVAVGLSLVLGQYYVAIFGALFVFAFGLIVIGMRHFAEHGGPMLQTGFIVLGYSCILLMAATLAMFFLSFFFRYPRPVAELFDVPRPLTTLPRNHQVDSSFSYAPSFLASLQTTDTLPELANAIWLQWLLVEKTPIRGEGDDQKRFAVATSERFDEPLSPTTMRIDLERTALGEGSAFLVARRNNAVHFIPLEMVMARDVNTVTVRGAEAGDFLLFLLDVYPKYADAILPERGSDFTFKLTCQ